MEKQNPQIVKVENKILYALALAVIVIVLSTILFINERNGISRTETDSSSALSSSESTFDFGAISMQNGKIAHQFEVKNNGTEAIMIEKVYTSCMCTTAYIIDNLGKRYGAFGMPGHAGAQMESVPVLAGTFITVEAIFDPSAHGPSGVGFAKRSIYLETNSISSPKLELSFQATVTK